MANNIQDSILKNHRYCRKLTNNDYGNVAFLINKNDILKDKKANENSFHDPELRYNCIYFLIGYEQDANNNTIEKMYVGQAGKRDHNGESVLDRLNEHIYKGNDPEKYLDKWTDVVVVTNEKDTWGATELNAIEHIFWSLIPVGNRYNSKKPESTGADLEKYTNAVNQIKEYLDYLGYQMFKNKTQEKLAEDIKIVAEAKSDLPVDLDHGTTRIPNITTPSWVVEKMLDILPQELFDNPDTIFFDPACKRSEYLKAIMKRCLKSQKHRLYFSKSDNPKLAQAIHIINKQLYGIALSPGSLKIAVENLYGTNNIITIPNYLNKIKNSTDFSNILNEEFNRDMKFDVVIGNPPYNDDDTKVATAIYSKFVEHGMKISNECTSFIIPSRWYASGRGLDSFRNMMLTGHKLKKLVDYEDAKKVFPTTQIAGGVCYFLADKNNNISCEVTTIDNNGNQKTLIRELDKYDVFIRDPKALGIVDKVTSKDDFKSLSIGVQSVDYFNVKDNFEVYAKKKDGMIEIEDASGTLYAYRYYLNDPYNLIDSYNVAVTHAVGSKDYVIPKTLHILEAGKACSVTYLCVGGTKNRENAEHLLKFIKTKFTRFLLKQAISSINISSKSFSFVPIQDFNSLEYQTCNDEDKIDWSQSLLFIDQQLYKKYKLTEEEIAYIESTIKPMDEDIKPQYTAQDVMANFVNKQLQNNSIT